MRSILLTMLFALAAGADRNVQAGDYLILDLAGRDAAERDDSYHAVARRLAELRNGEIVAGDFRQLPALLPVLQQKQPHYVAVIVRPGDLDINMARAFLKLSTQVDDDPFVDFAYGFITGDTPETALALAEAGVHSEKKRSKPSLAVAAVGTEMVTRSAVYQQQFALRKKSLPQLWGQIAGGENFAGIGRDAKFIKQLMPQLPDHSLIMLAGHGYPAEIVGGPTWKDFEGLKFDGAVVLNIACYTGVTGRWFEDDQANGLRRERTIPAGESVCLAVLRAKPAAYVGYACPRPAGPELFMDVPALAAEGLSVGEVRRRDYNRVVLAHVAQGFTALPAVEYTDGDRIRPPRNIVRDLLLEMSTGGMLFGDPAFTPFAAQPDETPVEVTTQRNGERIAATVAVRGQHLFLNCSEPLATWGADQQPVLRLMARLPLGQDRVAEVTVKEIQAGEKIAGRRLVWAVEEDRGERFLHVKVLFPQPAAEKLATLQAGARAVFEVVTTKDANASQTRFVGKEEASP